MGRNPILTRIARYLEMVGPRFNTTTLENKRYTLLALERRFNELRHTHPEKVLEADPIRWREKEVLELLELLKTNEGGGKTALSSQVQTLAMVEGFLAHIGNPIIAQLRREAPQKFPHRQETVRKSSLSIAQVEQIRHTCEQLPGWRGSCARFLVVGYAFTGARLSEFRRARRMDLDMTSSNPDEWTLEIAFPKAERLHGIRKVPIPAPMRPALARFLQERKETLSGMGLADTPERPLVFSPKNPEKSWSKATIEHLAAELRSKTGIHFSVHSFRRTYGQLLVDRGTSIETVSNMMGHSSSTVTEKYYCRKSADRARTEVLRSFAQPSAMAQSAKNSLISERFDFTGYA